MGELIGIALMIIGYDMATDRLWVGIGIAMVGATLFRLSA